MQVEKVFPADVDDNEITNKNKKSVAAKDEPNHGRVNSKQRKKALLEFRCRVEDAIRNNYILGKSKGKVSHESTENLRNISLWGVPLLPSKGHGGTDVVLMKFLKSRDYKVSEAFTMLRKTLKWNREFNAEGILDEKFGSHLENVMFIEGTDKDGHPLCYNVFGAFKDKELHDKTFGSDEKVEEFLRWRVQIMELGIKKLSFKPGGVDSIVHITDLKNALCPPTKELRLASKKIVNLFQENYPRLISRNIVVNVPFWTFFLHELQSRFRTPRNNSKLIFARPSKVTETLLKYIDPEEIPIQYGGLKRENDDHFSSADKVLELFLKGNANGTIQIPVAEVGVTMIWDITVVGYEVTYREEFVPDDDCSYKVLLQKEKKMEESVRNSFYISEPGKIEITIENNTFKRKRVLYRYKSKPTVPIYLRLK